MKRIDNARVAVDCPMSGPPGDAPGHIHASSRDGLTYQCVGCGAIHHWRWREIDAANEQHLELFAHLASVRLPECACGAVAFLNHSDVEYGLELPHHYTARAVREHIAPRRAFKGLALNRHAPHERHQGSDFSHLPPGERPPHHVDPAE